MGGSAFAQAFAPEAPTLNTPRMTPEEYENIRRVWIRELEAYFPNCNVKSLREAPEKESYGDIDISVALNQRVDFVAMAQELGAKGVICRSGGNAQKCSLAVYKDISLRSTNTIVYKLLDAKNPQTQGGVTTAEYVQLDVEILETELVDWHVFYSSYGDLAGILGRIVTYLGFSITDRGFILRTRELDDSKTSQIVNIADKDGMVFLSRNPKKVMEFLGVSVEDFYKGFTTLEEMYQWVGKCRLLRAEPVKLRRDKAHDRYREQKRTVFSGFFKEWLPRHMDMKPEQDVDEVVESIKRLRKIDLIDALDFFSHVREEFNFKELAVLKTINNATAGALLKPIIAEHSGKKDKGLNEILRAFRRHVGVDEEGHPSILNQPHTDAQSQLDRLLGVDGTSFKDPDAVSEWVKQDWEVLRALERKRGRPDEPMAQGGLGSLSLEGNGEDAAHSQSLTVRTAVPSSVERSHDNHL